MPAGPLFMRRRTSRKNFNQQPNLACRTSIDEWKTTPWCNIDVENMDIRWSWKKQKWDLSINPKFFTCLMVYRSWGKKSFSDSDMFSWVELDPKFGILAFSAIFVLFFWVAKNLIYIDNALNGYSYLKSTRKGLSDGTLMLKKEYRLARWNCDWKSYTFPKNHF